MSLLRRFLSFATDPEVVAGFQKSCGIIYSPESDESKKDDLRNGEINRHQNGISTGAVLNGNATPVNGTCAHSSNGNGTDGLKCTGYLNSEFDSHIKHKNGVVRHRHDCLEKGMKKTSVIHSGTVPFRIENKFLYYLFNFGAQLGNAVFYIIFYCYSFWNFDYYVLRRVCFVWCACMYIGQAAKDIVRVPRPKSPPVVRLETRYELEYGMPSTHAIVATVIPFSMIIFTNGRYEYSLIVGLVIAVAWCLLVCLSRIYLGMHNILDVIVGLLFAITIMTFTVPIADAADQFLVTHPLSPIICLSFPIILTWIYPNLDKWSMCRGDTTLILSLTAGVFFGTWLNHYQGFLKPSDVALPLELNFQVHNIFMNALRFMSGVVVTVSTMGIVKTSSLKFLCSLLNLDPKDSKSKQIFAVELPYKYLTYVSTSFVTVYLAPLMFNWIGISRLSYYSEI